MESMINHIKMEIEISKVGERGQIVIPQEIREKMKIKKGEKFLVIREKEDIIFRPINKIKSLDSINEDIIDMQIANKRWKEIEKGEYKRTSKKEFLNELKGW